MLYNLRSDIIYYKSGSDFELEFNLCGCCRMRLLTDKPSNKKAFVHSLARAVSRSRVILIAGAIFGEESTIQIVSQALGTTTEVVNNSAYNIASDDEIEIIKGSVPLVSSDGSFGGCIIESGPQTMILLTDNKTLRKNIMSTLIHPYISELYAAEVQANGEKKAETEANVEVAPVTAEALEPTPVITEAEPETFIAEEAPIIEEEVIEEAIITEDTSEELPSKEIIAEDIIIDDTKTEEDTAIQEPTIELYTEVTEEADDISVTPTDLTQIILDTATEEENTPKPNYENVFSSLYLEDEKEQKQDNISRHNNQADGYQMLYDNGDIISESDANNEGRTSRLNIATIIVTVILLLSIIVLCFCIFSASSNEGMAPTEYIRSVWQAVFG